MWSKDNFIRVKYEEGLLYILLHIFLFAVDKAKELINILRNHVIQFVVSYCLQCRSFYINLYKI